MLHNTHRLTTAILIALLHFGCSSNQEPCCGEELPTGKLSEDSLYQLTSIWRDANGGELQLTSFRGKTVVLAMMFTRCSYACPRTLADLQQIEAGLPVDALDHTQFVLISMDTERDTPADLQQHQAAHDLDDQRWTLLCGDSDSVRELAAVLGFNYRRDPGGDYSHSNQITILNAEGEIAHRQTGLGSDPRDTIDAIATAAHRR